MMSATHDPATLDPATLDPATLDAPNTCAILTVFPPPESTKMSSVRKPSIMTGPGDDAEDKFLCGLAKNHHAKFPHPGSDTAEIDLIHTPSPNAQRETIIKVINMDARSNAAQQGVGSLARCAVCSALLRVRRHLPP